MPEFEGVRDVWPRGARLEAIRDASRRFHERFAAGPQVRALRTIDLAAGAYHTRFAFGGAVQLPVPYVYPPEPAGGGPVRGLRRAAQKTFVWEPLVPDGTAEAPYYSQAIEKYGDFLANKVFSKRFNSVEQGWRSAACGPRTSTSPRTTTCTCRTRAG